LPLGQCHECIRANKRESKAMRFTLLLVNVVPKWSTPKYGSNLLVRKRWPRDRDGEIADPVLLSRKVARGKVKENRYGRHQRVAGKKLTHAPL